MQSASDQQPRKKIVRRNFIVDKPTQMAAILSVVGTLTGATFLFIAGVFVLPGAEFFDRLSGESTRSLLFKLTAIYFAICVIGVAFLTVVLTHRVSGPAMVLERAVRGMMRRDYGQRLKLRKKDYLQGLSDCLVEFRAELEERDAGDERLFAEMEAALADGDTERVRELLASRTGVASSTEEPVASA